MAFNVDYTVFKDVWEKEYTLTRQLYRNVVKYADKVAIIDPYRDKALTYKEWDEASNRFAHALIDAGMGPQDVVMADMFNTYEWFIVYMGAAKARAVLPLLNFMLPEGQLCKLMDGSKPTVFVYDAALTNVCLKTIELAKNKPKLCVMCGEGELPD